MDILKKLFPFSFGKKADVAALIINIILHLVVGLIAAAIIGLASMVLSVIPVIGGILAWAIGVIAALVDLYVVIGIVLSVLDYCKILK